MTLFGRDASNFDATVNYTGLSFFTHKATEGISVVHDQCGPRLTAAQAAGVPVLGAYHVLRTPSTSNGSLAGQLAFWIDNLDAHTPWWRAHPHFVLQVDAERWPYDDVSASTVLEFAAMLAGAQLPGWKVTYASRGQYGDSLAGIRTPLWNADYSGSSAGSYPGDTWAPGWAPYSGQTPVFLQYTSTPYDMNAFRGTLAQLLETVGGYPGPVDPGTIGDNTMILVQAKGSDAVYLADGMTRRWIRNPQELADVRYVASSQVGAFTLWNDGAIYGPVDDLDAFGVLIGPDPAGTPAPAPVTLTDAQVAALGTQVGQHLDGRLEKLVQLLGPAAGAAATVPETPQG